MLNENIHTEYPAYNGMNRPALFFGAPLMPMVIFIFAIMMIAMIAQLIIGKAGLLLVGLLIPIYFGLKTISQNDDQVFSIYALEAKWLLRRMAAGTKLATFTLHTGNRRPDCILVRTSVKYAQKEAGRNMPSCMICATLVYPNPKS